MAVVRTLWTALVGLYEETLPLVGGNLAALALNLPLGVALFMLGLPFLALLGQPAAGAEDSSAVQWLSAIIAWLLPFLPTPGNVALAGLTQQAAGPDVPRLTQFRQYLRSRWRLALRCSLLSLVVLLALVWNVHFYLTVATDWLRFVSILWLYATLFWLSLHVYLLPLMVHVAEPRLLDLYKRAAFISLGHFGYTLLLLLVLLMVGFVAVIFLPLYVLIGGAFISLVEAHALREIRRRHGDLVVEAEQQIGQL